MHKRRRTFKKKKSKGCVSFFLIIFLIFASYVFFRLYKKYSYTKEKVNLTSYIGVSGNDVAIYFNDEKIKTKNEESTGTVGLLRYSNVYIPLSFIQENINPVFYFDKELNRVLYSLSTETLIFNGTDIFENIAPIYLIEEEPYLLIDFVKKYSPIRFSSFTS